MAKINLVVAQAMLDVEDDINQSIAMEDDWYDVDSSNQAWLDEIEDARRESEYQLEMEMYDPYQFDDPYPFDHDDCYGDYHYHPNQGPK